MPLSALLSRVLVAFAVEFERETATSLAISANVLRVLGEDWTPVRDLPVLAGVSKEAVSMATGFLARHGRAETGPVPAPGRGQRIRLTPSGRQARDRYGPLTAAIEDRWRARWGEALIGDLRTRLERLAGPAAAGPDVSRPGSPIVPSDLSHPDSAGAPSVPGSRSDSRSAGSPSNLGSTDARGSTGTAGSAGARGSHGSPGLRDMPGELSNPGGAGDSSGAPSVPGSRNTPGASDAPGNPGGPGASVISRSSRSSDARGGFGVPGDRGALGAPGAAGALGAPGGPPLMRGLEPYPDGWRAEVRRPEALPHYPMVLHRVGYPDGS